MSGIKEEMIELIKKNKISTTEVADCMGKAGLFENSHAVNRGHFAVGTVRWVYAYDNSNYTVHEQIRDTQPGDIVLIEAFNCGERSTIGELVTKFIVLYKEAAAVITNGNLRDGNDLIKQNYPIWCKGLSPIGCFNKKPERELDEEIRKAHYEMYDGSIAVCDDSGVVIIPKELHTREFIQKLNQIEEQEDIWFTYLDRYKWDTFDIVCLKKYLKSEEEKR